MSQLLREVVAVARDLPPAILESVVAELSLSSNGPISDRLARLGATPATRIRLERLCERLSAVPGVNAKSLALAIQAGAAAFVRASGEQSLEIAWTGPSTEAVALRRVDQVLYEFVNSAETEVLLVTYAMYKAERALEVLQRASDRGVRVSLVLELARESGGKISFDGLDAVRAAVPRAAVFYWPLDRRPLSSSGSQGAMHVKCLVVDRKRALVSSANLTDYALELNMELGLVAEGLPADRLARHFEQLVLRGELAPAP